MFQASAANAASAWNIACLENSYGIPTLLQCFFCDRIEIESMQKPWTPRYIKASDRKPKSDVDSWWYGMLKGWIQKKTNFVPEYY